MSRGGQDYYVQADHQGSVIRVTDSAGAVVNSYTYDAYGQRLTATDGVEIAYGYTGREYDAESGLMYYRARVYDPAMGRFLQTDPLGFAAGDLNLYGYVGSNPVNAIDPTGLTILPFPKTPTTLDRLSDFAEGLYSYPRGIGRAARFGARYAGILGQCEADRASREVDLLVDIGVLLWENGALRDVAGDLLLDHANRKSDVIEGRTTAMGLVILGSTGIRDWRAKVALGIIGLSAIPGDIMYTMEKGARTVEDLIPAVLEGALPENLQPSKSCDCPNGA
jgi:RHS repeat-associated protein